MHRIARAIEGAAIRHGARFRYTAPVAEILVERGRVAGVRLASGERLAADAVIANTDVAALATGGSARCRQGRAGTALRPPLALGGHLLHDGRGHGLSAGPPQRLLLGRLRGASSTTSSSAGSVPGDPTVYVCAQDRGDGGGQDRPGPSACLCLINAPATRRRLNPPVEIEQCATRLHAVLARSGLQLEVARTRTTVTTPMDFERLFPATGGALYGPASHGWQASFQRPGAKTQAAGPLPGGRQRASGPGRADGGAVGAHGGAGLAGGPRFDARGTARRLPLVVCRRTERRRPPSASPSSPSSAASSRPTTTGRGARARPSR